MTAKSLYIILVITYAMVIMYACTEPTVPAAKKFQPQHTFSVKGSVREMNLQPEILDFPEHEGKAEFMSYCSMCHSLKYITAQPDFPRKTWEAEVHKMVEKYSAPIDSVTGKKIVAYLMAIKGQQ